MINGVRELYILAFAEVKNKLELANAAVNLT
jgi:hypothetical protein